jgi:Bax protein
MVSYLSASMLARPFWWRLSWLPFVLYPLQAGQASIASSDHCGVLTSAEITLCVPRREVEEPPETLRDRSLNSAAKKRVFIDTVLPLVLMENEAVALKRERMLSLLERIEQGTALSARDKAWLTHLAREYRVKDDLLTSEEARKKLRQRVDVIPVELALAQAAIESGWGRSRYLHSERDLFGMTAFRPGRGSERSVKGKKQEPKFSSLRDSVSTYMLVLNAHPAYRPMRVIRTKLRKEEKPLDGVRLADGLTKYSERGQAYIKMVKTMIRSSDLDRYALAMLEPAGRQQLASLREVDG